MPIAPDASISQRTSPRPDLLVFEIKGKITKPDIEWMSSLSDEAMRSQGSIDMLIIMSNYEGLDVGAMFDAYAAGVMTRSIAHIRRYGVVGAPTFAEAMINLSGTVLPVETKTFALEDEQEAWVWLGETPPEQGSQVPGQG